MFLIGENINIMSKSMKEAILKKDSKTIVDIAIAQAEAGMDMLDINLGPARKDGPEIMEWIVKTVQEVVDLPLSLDTTNIEAIEAGLRIHRGKALINSISARPERMKVLMPMAKRYNAGFIGLTIGAEGIPRDANERGFLAAQILAEASNYDIDEEDIWLDPVVLPVNSQQMQIIGCTEFTMMLKDIAPNSKSTCGISNVSNGVPTHLRPVLNRTYLIILKRYGMYSAIINAFDDELIKIAKGKRPDIEGLVYRVMDGEELDYKTLTKEEIDYVKTTHVLTGRTIYSDAWLEL